MDGRLTETPLGSVRAHVRHVSGTWANVTDAVDIHETDHQTLTAL